jgi:hypothetical protein
MIESRNTSLPFKGRVRVGMGFSIADPTPIPTFPLRGKGFSAAVFWQGVSLCV